MLSERATAAFEGARAEAAALPRRRAHARDHLHPQRHRGDQPGGAELGRQAPLGPGDEVLISAMEHHSNIVPWQLACERTGARLRVIPIDDRGVLDLDAFHGLLTARTRMVAIVASLERPRHGEPGRATSPWPRTPPAPRCWSTGRRRRYHRPVDVQALGVRLLRVHRPQALRPDRHRRALRHHRAARGDAAVPGRRRHDLARSPSRRAPGTCCRTSSRPARRTSKARSGWPRRCASCAASASTGSPRTSRRCWPTAPRRCRRCPACRLIGTAPEKASILSFVLEGVHPHDIGTIVDQHGRGHPHRPSLRAAGDGALRHAGHGPGLAGHVQHHRRRRSPRRGAPRVRRMFAVMSGLVRALPGSHPRPQPAAAELPRPSRAPPARRATTRSAATG